MYPALYAYYMRRIVSLYVELYSSYCNYDSYISDCCKMQVLKRLRMSYTFVHMTKQLLQHFISMWLM